MAPDAQAKRRKLGAPGRQNPHRRPRGRRCLTRKAQAVIHPLRRKAARKRHARGGRVRSNDAADRADVGACELRHGDGAQQHPHRAAEKRRRLCAKRRARPAAVRFRIAQSCFGGSFQIIFILPQQQAPAQRRLRKRGVFAPQKRHDLLPDAVSARIRRGVCGVLHMRQRVFREIRLNFAARQAEHRPHDVLALRRDAAQAAQRRAARQVEKHRLQIVVGGVRRGDQAVQLRKKRIAQLPSRLLHALARPCRMGGDVRAGDAQRNAERLAKRADERLVAVGFRAAQAVVEVRRRDRDPQLRPKRAQGVQHRHGVRAAGDGADDVRAARKERLLPAPDEDLIPHASTPDRRRS